MLTLFRKSEYFNERINKKFNERLEKVPEEKRTEILKIKAIEEERDTIMKSFEEEMKNLELKYDQLLRNVCDKKAAKLNEDKSLFENYWLRALSNHKITKDFIAEEDKDALKYLKNVKSIKLENANSFQLIFEFNENEYFSNTTIEKTYHVSNDLLIEKIESTQIQWKEGKNLCSKNVSKTLKNKKTGEKKTVEKNEPKLSFFNFFTNLRMPSLDEMKNLDYEVEKELGLQLDTEYEIGIEIIDELIPYSMEYFVGVTHDADEFTEYMHERMIEQQEKGKKKKTKY